jgi:spermidine/putrescine transport system substrate-binding protein
VANEGLDELMARMARTRVNRRSFLAAAGLLGGSAALAACTPSSSASPASSAAASSGAASAAPSTAAAASFPPAGAIEEELFMYNWSSYVAPKNMTDFQAEFGVKNFVYDIFANNDELLAKLAAGASGYDFACPTAEFMPQMAAQGYIQKLDYSRIPNFKYIDPAVLSQPWDPKNEYHVPKDFGTTGVMYRPKLVSEPLTSWKEFYDLAVGKYSGKVVLVDSAGDVLVMPLKMLGYSVNSVDPKELDEASKLLQDLAPHVLALDSDTYQVKLANEEAAMALCWTGGLVELRADPATADVKYIVPSEGTLFWMDVWTMMADAPHPNATYAWFDFIERPEPQALETTTNGYGTPNLEAQKLLPPEMLNDPAYFPPADVMARLEGANPDAADNPDRLAVWSKFKSSLGG